MKEAKELFSQALGALAAGAGAAAGAAAAAGAGAFSARHCRERRVPWDISEAGASTLALTPQVICDDGTCYIGIPQLMILNPELNTGCHCPTSMASSLSSSSSFSVTLMRSFEAVSSLRPEGRACVCVCVSGVSGSGCRRVRW